MKIRFGSIYGICFLISLTKLDFGFPIFLVLNFFLLKKYYLTPFKQKVLLFLCVKVLWMYFIFLIFGYKTNFDFLRLLTPDIILILILFLNVDEAFLNDFYKMLILLYFIDLFFNLCVLFVGVDPLGRGRSLREGDTMPRLLGVFGNPFYSINISFITFCVSLYFGRKKICLMALSSLFITGSMKGPIIGCSIIMIIALIYFRLSILFYILAFLLFASSIFFLTYLSSLHADYVSGNFLRVIAWQHGLENVIKNPIWGVHDFIHHDFKVMSVSTIINYGITESPILQYVQDFGVIPAFCFLFTLFYIFYYNFKAYKNARLSRKIAMYSLTGGVLVDCAYGTIFGSFFTTFVYGLFAISLNNENRFEGGNYNE